MTERHENQPISQPGNQPSYAPSTSPGAASSGTYRPGEAAPLADQGSAQMGSATTGSPAEQAREYGQHALDEVKEKGGQAASAAEERANQGIDKAAEATQGLADTLRQKAGSLPGEKPTQLAHQAASGLERGADYLRQADVTEMRGDLEQLIRRYPAQSLAVGAVIGFLVARAFR
jgi:ElaB/YqjD/DUF883 family membrane-anchored ribosome-binding protein